MKDEYRVRLDLERAVEAHRAGDLETAARRYKKVLRARPRNFDALHMLGVIDFVEGRPKSALERISLALTIAPDSAEALSNRSLVRLSLGDASGALADADEALRLAPLYPAAHCNRANALLALEHLDDSLTAFAAALEQDPFLAEAWSGQSLALIRLRRLLQAKISAERAVELAPHLADGWCNLGLAAHEAGDLDTAQRSYDRALALNPQHPDALYNRGIARHARGDFQSALSDLLAARRLKRFDGDLGQILHTQMNLCEWEEIDQSLLALSQAITAGDLATTPFYTLGLFDDPALHLQAARTYVARFIPKAGRTRGASASDGMSQTRAHAADRIRVGYLSADFRSHPTAFLFIEPLEQRNRSRFEAIAFSLGPRDDTRFGARVRASFDEFLDVGGLEDIALASLISSLQIDILVDLMGHTHLSRPGVLAARPCVIQVGFLGYPGSMGSPFIDYLVADPIVAPDPRYFDEALCLLPDTYHPTSRPLDLSPSGSRLDHGLPAEGFVFCCFCNNWKITPQVFQSWMRVLNGASGSVLWLLANNSAVAANLTRQAAKAGIDPARLVFAARTDHGGHLARHRLADIALDTFPYGAHTTASDALRAGVPFISRYGASFQSRVGRSILEAAGVPEFAVSSAPAYEALALSYAHSPARLDAARDAVARAQTSPLFNASRFIGHLEAGFEAMLDRLQRGLSPAEIRIDKRSSPN